MRCRVCDLPHKNTNRHRPWIQNHICRVWSFFFEFFSFNSNQLKEYWEKRGNE